MTKHFARMSRGFTIALFALIASALVIALTAMSVTAPRLLTNALIMGGTFQPNPDRPFVDMAIDDFIAPTLDPALNPAVTRDLAPYRGTTVSYPASGGITGGIGLPTINQSVAIGVTNLDAAIAMQPADQPVVVFGFSQSTVVSMIEKTRLAERKARGEPVPDIVFVGIGVGNRPHGGIASLLNGITIPFFDFTFNGPAPNDPEFGFTTIDIAREYDGLADFPLYPVNLLADLNALLGILFVHARYDEVSLDPTSPKYVEGTIRQQYGDTTYYQIPTHDLPLFEPLRIIGVPEALIDVVEPLAKVLIDTAYDRTIPFGEPTGLRLIPKIDPIRFTTDVAAAVGTGIANAVRIVAPPSRDDTTGPADDAVDAAASSAVVTPLSNDSESEPPVREADSRTASQRVEPDEADGPGAVTDRKARRDSVEPAEDPEEETVDTAVDPTDAIGDSEPEDEGGREPVDRPAGERIGKSDESAGAGSSTDSSGSEDSAAA